MDPDTAPPRRPRARRRPRTRVPVADPMPSPTSPTSSPPPYVDAIAVEALPTAAAESEREARIEQLLDQTFGIHRWFCPLCEVHVPFREQFHHLCQSHYDVMLTWASVNTSTWFDTDLTLLEHATAQASNANANAFGAWPASFYHGSLNTQNAWATEDDETAGWPDVDELSYEELLNLCETIGTHKVGVANLDDVSEAVCDVINASPCVICMESLEHSHAVRRLTRCKHQFCEPCISRWLKENKTCPLCMQNVEEDCRHDHIADTSISPLASSSGEAPPLSFE